MTVQQLDNMSVFNKLVDLSGIHPRKTAEDDCMYIYRLAVALNNMTLRDWEPLDSKSKAMYNNIIHAANQIETNKKLRADNRQQISLSTVIGAPLAGVNVNIEDMIE